MSADTTRLVMSAWAVHERRFTDLVQANQAIVDAIEAHRATIPEPRGLAALLTYARGQVEGRWDAAGFADAGIEVEATLRTVSERLRRDLAAEHPLAVALQSYELALAQVQATRSTAQLVLGRVGNQHPDVVLAALPALRPLGRSHLDVMVALASFVGDAGVLGVFTWLGDFWRTRRRGLPPGPERDTCNALVDRAEGLGELVRGAPRPPGPPEEAIAAAQDDLAENPKDLRALRRLAEGLAAVGQHARSLEAWLTLLERMDNESGEGAVCMAAAAQAEAAGFAEQALELRRLGRCVSPPTGAAEVAWRLGSPAPYVRLRAFNAARALHDPGVARAMVALLKRAPPEGEPWGSVWPRGLGYAIGTTRPEPVVAQALLEVEIPDSNMESWISAASLNGDPRLRARGNAWLPRLRGALEALANGDDWARREYLERLIESWEAVEEEQAIQ